VQSELRVTEEQSVRTSQEFELKPWEPEDWSPRHDLVVRLHLAGIRNKDIPRWMEQAGAESFCESRISVILNDPRAQQLKEHFARTAIDRMENVQERLEAVANEALTEVIELMRRAEDASVRQRSAFSILDRAGYSKIERKTVANFDVTEKLLDRMERAAKEGRSLSDLDYGKALPVPKPPDEEAVA
jgi:hypothetical protein